MKRRMRRRALSGKIYGLRDPVLLVEPGGTVVAGNPQASELFRRPVRQMVGKSLSGFVAGNREELIGYLRQCSQNSEGISFQLDIPNPNEQPTICQTIGGSLIREGEGQLIWLRFLPRECTSAAAARLIGNMHALTEANLKHQQNEYRWQNAFENSAIGMMMVDVRGYFFAANNVFRNMLGYSESELYRLTFLQITYEDDRATNAELVRELLEGRRQQFQIEKRYRRKDSTLLWARTNVALVPGVDSIAPFWFAVVEDITDRKRAEEGLRDREAQLEAFFGNSPNLIFLKDKQGRYLYTNREFHRAFDVKEERIRGRKDDEIFPAEEAIAFAANDAQVLDSGAALQFEEIALYRDGPHTNIVHKFPLRDAKGEIYAVGGIVTDITARKQAEEDLLAAKNELSAELVAMTRLHEFSTRLLEIGEFQPLIEDVLDATIALQAADSGDIQLYSSEKQSLQVVAHHGFPDAMPEDFRSGRHISLARGPGIPLRERVIIDDVEADFRFAPYRHLAELAGFRAVQRTPILSRQGEFLGILSTYFRKPHRPSPRELRFTDLYARHAANIIEKKRLEARAEASQHSLHTTQAELARVCRLTTMGELAASIAHEVNQPLSAITNNSNACLRLLAHRKLTPRLLRRALEEIVTEGTRASAVIARIRAFIMKEPANRKDLILNDVIRGVLPLAAGELKESGVLLEHNLAAHLPCVLGDRVQLQQVLLNLMINAIEAMSEVTNRPRTLVVESRLDEHGNVLVAIRDSGIGLSSNTSRVFEPFFTTKTTGMGMGLCISRTIIEAHGGRLWATPNSPYGAVFFFSLPASARNSS